MNKIIVALVVVIGGIWVASSVFGPKAPLRDGLYLSYDCGGSPLRVTFSEVGRNKFKATVSPGDSQEIINTRFKTKSGAVYQIDLLGPLWIPPDEVKVGGNAHGDKVAEVKHWEKWDVGVVKATFGVGAALRGEWYYEKNTGFLVGGSKATAIQLEGEGMHFVLKETNLEAL